MAVYLRVSFKLGEKKSQGTNHVMLQTVCGYCPLILEAPLTFLSLSLLPSHLNVLAYRQVSKTGMSCLQGSFVMASSRGPPPEQWCARGSSGAHPAFKCLYTPATGLSWELPAGTAEQWI